MAVREGAVRIDGKLCTVSHCNKVSSTSSGGDNTCDAATAAEARTEVQNFITRHELGATAAAVLLRADPKTALRVVRGLIASHSKISDSLVHAELKRVVGSSLSKELERRVSEFVGGIGLSDDSREKVLSMFLAQRPEDIEQVLVVSQRRGWVNEILSKDNPSLWLLSQFNRLRREQARDDIQAFTTRFNFGDDVRQQLCELSCERARRLMKSWNPSGPGMQRQLQKEFIDSLAESLHDYRWQRERRRHEASSSESGAIGSHARILQEWSDEEDGMPVLPSINEQLGRTSAEASLFEAFDADTALPDASALPRPSRRSSSLGIGQKSSDAASASKTKRRQPKPTHFIMCVDSSGSMITDDCCSGEGDTVSRLDAVLETCSNFIAESAMNMEDRYSFVTFNEESVLHFSLYKAFDAQTELESLRPTAKSQTRFSMGIRGIHAAIREDHSRLPARVVFLSDGEPSDPGSYLRDMQILVKKYPGDALKIYAVGFGESAKVTSAEGDFYYLQQLACLGHGHFQRCGASLSSLQGAFTAVTSTISRTRSASSAGNSRQQPEVAESLPSAASNPWDLQLRPGTVGAGSQQATTTIATIKEAAEGAESGSDEESCASQGGDSDPQIQPVGAAAAQVEFELPNPSHIFSEINDGSKWKDFKAAQTSFSFDGHSFVRKCDVKHVFLRRRPFMKGGMRLVYGMLHAENKDNLERTEARMCAKRLFQDLDKEQGFQAHAAFCKSTAVAQYYSKSFKQALKDTGTKHKLIFLSCHLYSPIGKEGGYHFCGEDLLKGHFVKLNSNAGFVNEADYSSHSAIAQAFSHFTFDRSHGELMVVDLQGVCAETDAPYSLLTDPQVHSRGAFERFGPGDLGNDGIRKFFHGHKCGELCRKLGLRKEVDIHEPTRTLKMPGVDGLIKHMLGGDSKDFFHDLRKKCRISSITVPREAHSDWIDIKIWAERGMQWNKALKLLEERMEVFFNDARKVVVIDAAFRQWGVEAWQRQLEAWKRASNALIIPYPADWKAKNVVQEVWVFSDSRYNSDNRDYAVKEMQKDLDRFKREGSPGAHDDRQEATGSGTAEDAWERYQDHNGQKYWYRADGQWFYESDRRWSRYTDAQDKPWWWNEKSGIWFYEPDKRK
jgi:hypothetical protein